MKNVRQIDYYLKYSDYADFQLTLSMGTQPALLNFSFRFYNSGNLKNNIDSQTQWPSILCMFERTG